jgi:DNA-binding HxlR family transcriptional regulator
VPLCRPGGSTRRFNSVPSCTSASVVRGVRTDSLSRAVAVLDGKWTLLVIRDLLGGPKRFGELRDSLAGISPKTLTDRLRDLESAGVLSRTMYPQIPPRVEYRLSDLGRSLAPVMNALAEFGRSLPIA